MARHFIRERVRTTASHRDGEDSTWTEFQVCFGRAIVSRHLLRAEAEQALEALGAREAAAARPARQ